MKKINFKIAIQILSICFLSISNNIHSQGFATSYTNWAMPSGGYYDWNAHNYGFNAIAESGSTYLNCNGWSTIDMNGDNKPDLVVTSQGDGTYGNGFSVGSNPYWKVYLNNGSGYSTTSTNWSLPSGGYYNWNGHNYGYNAIAQSGSTYLNCLGWSTLDMNGDNKPDLVVVSQGDGTYGNSFSVSSSPYWKVYLNTGSGFATTYTNWPLPSGGYSYQSHNYGFNATAGASYADNNCNGWSTLDMNGDNKPDLVVVSQGDGTYGNGFSVGSNPYWKVYLNTGSGFATTYTNWPLPSGGYSYQSHNYGFNATGGASYADNNCNGWSTLDMNGDGKPDLVVTSQGDGTYGNCFGVSSSPYWKVYLNTGSGMSTSSTNWTLPSGGYYDWNAHNYGYNAIAQTGSTYLSCRGWTTLDINGDDKPDLIVDSEGDGTYGNSFGVSSSPHWKVYFNTGSAMSTSATNWTCPSGGYVDQSAHNYGFNATAETGSTYLNCLGWSTLDMNGDSKPDLVVDSQGDGTYGNSFSVGSNPYWKVYLNTTTSGINQAENDLNTISVYPNPFASTITVSVVQANRSQLDVYNLAGELVYSSQIQNEKTEIDLSKLSSGVYFVKLTSEDGVQTKKIIKQ